MSYYGVGIAEYHGEGDLTLKDGEKLNCKFEAGQLATGDVLLLCDFRSASHYAPNTPVCRFRGATTEGFPILAKSITAVNYLPRPPKNHVGRWKAFRLREMSVQMASANDGATTARFGITNFEFIGTKKHGSNKHFCLILPLILESRDNVTNLSLIRVKDYNRILQRIKTLKGIDVTCEAVGDIPKEGITRLTETIDDLCYLLSVARGTKIQWIYRDLYDEAGELIQQTHYSKITKPFCPLVIIDARAVGRDETKTFIERTYPIYLEKKESWRLNRGTIDAYLDAKAERDYCQMRGIKLAVAMETLKSVFLELPECAVTEDIIPALKFKELKPRLKKAISEVLKRGSVEKNPRGAVYSKLEELNRTSFKNILVCLCEFVQLEVEKQALKLFIASRNSLVHNGIFCCESSKPEERQKCIELSSPLDEYFFLVNFLDRVFLKLLGYSGLYMNWRLPWPPRKEEV